MSKQMLTLKHIDKLVFGANIIGCVLCMTLKFLLHFAELHSIVAVKTATDVVRFEPLLLYFSAIINRKFFR